MFLSLILSTATAAVVITHQNFTDNCENGKPSNLDRFSIPNSPTYPSVFNQTQSASLDTLIRMIEEFANVSDTGKGEKYLIQLAELTFGNDSTKMVEFKKQMNWENQYVALTTECDLASPPVPFYDSRRHMDLNNEYYLPRHFVFYQLSVGNESISYYNGECGYYRFFEPVFRFAPCLGLLPDMALIIEEPSRVADQPPLEKYFLAGKGMRGVEEKEHNTLSLYDPNEADLERHLNKYLASTTFKLRPLLVFIGPLLVWLVY